MIGLSLATAARSAWTHQASLWRIAATTGRHPTTGRAHDREACLAGHKRCLAFGRWAAQTVQPQGAGA